MGNLEEDIKQERFANDTIKALINVMYTSNWIRDNHSGIFKDYKILGQHYNVLRIVRGRKGDPVTPGEIIKVMLDKGRDLTRLVDKLVKLGFLKREQSPVNRRKVNIHITEEGLRVTNEIEQKMDAWMSENIQMTDEETRMLNELLDKMRSFD